MDYVNFLERRQRAAGISGFDTCFMPSRLFPFQQSLVEWAVAKGRAAVFADCGLGKSGIELAFAQNVVQHTNRHVLLLTPIAVGNQMAEEAKLVGVEAKVCREGIYHRNPHVVITNYERLHLFDRDKFAGIVCDECFPPETEVETLKHGCIVRTAIKDIRNGDEIYNASGRDRVVEIHRRKIDRAIKISVGGRIITSSENHPVFTQRGWVPAFGLLKGDSILETSAAVRLVSGGVLPVVSGDVEWPFLRDILLSEMADAPEVCDSVRAFGGGEKEKIGVKECMVQDPGSRVGVETNSGIESDEKSCIACESQPDIADDGAQTMRAWWKRQGDDEAAVIASGGTPVRMGGGVCCATWEKGTRVSDLLQSRFSRHREEACDRGGWRIAPEQERARCEEGQETGFVRVDGIEILESGHPEMDRWRDADGFVYFYDIKAERHPSFSVGGLLVHNSSIIKCYSGQMRHAVTEFCKPIPYRLLATATAAPNDYMELGTSAEALGVCRRTEMLATYFIHDSSDTGKWRLKKHAEKLAFWQWICSWARAVRKPSDLGFSNEGYDLPELAMHQHTVGAERDLAVGLAAQRAERKATIEDRIAKVANLCDHDEPSLCFCHLNQEGDMLTEAIRGAVQVSGSDKESVKEEKFKAFIKGQIRVLVTKPRIAGFGLNFQHCAHQTYFPSHSYEELYQSVRRSWRFGQQNPVDIDVVTSYGEANVVANLQRKVEQSAQMFDKMVQLMNSPAVKNPINLHSNPTQLPSWLQ